MNFLFLIWFLHFDFSLFESCFSAHYQRTEVGLIFLSPPVLYNWLHAAFPSFHPLLTSRPPLLFSQTGMTLESCAWQPGGGGEPGSSSTLALAGRLSPFVSPLPVWLSTLLFLFVLFLPWVWYHFSHPVESLFLSLVCFSIVAVWKFVLASLPLDSPVICLSVCLSVGKRRDLEWSWVWIYLSRQFCPQHDACKAVAATVTVIMIAVVLTYNQL